MSIIIPFLFVLGVIIIANLAEKDGGRSTKLLFDLLLAAVNVPILLFGVLFILLPQELSLLFLENDMPALNLDGMGWVLIGLAVYAILVCIRPVRRALARLMPIDPDSTVHTTALVLAGYLVGNTLLALTQDVLVELLATGVTVTIVDIVLQQVAFVAVAFFGAGLLIRRDLTEVNERLGLAWPTRNQMVLGAGTIGVLIALQWMIGAVWALLDPEQAAFLSEVNESLLAGFDSAGEWLILAVAAGIGEEVLFRGAIQPRFGIIFTSLLFAMVHVQYGLTPITLAVLLLAIILGVLRERTNTTVTIFVHFGYNFILGLFALLATYLQEMVS